MAEDKTEDKNGKFRVASAIVFALFLFLAIGIPIWQYTNPSAAAGKPGEEVVDANDPRKCSGSTCVRADGLLQRGWSPAYGLKKRYGPEALPGEGGVLEVRLNGNDTHTYKVDSTGKMTKDGEVISQYNPYKGFGADRIEVRAGDEKSIGKTFVINMVRND